MTSSPQRLIMHVHWKLPGVFAHRAFTSQLDMLQLHIYQFLTALNILYSPSDHAIRDKCQVHCTHFNLPKVLMLSYVTKLCSLKDYPDYVTIIVWKHR